MTSPGSILGGRGGQAKKTKFLTNSLFHINNLRKHWQNYLCMRSYTWNGTQCIRSITEWHNTWWCQFRQSSFSHFDQRTKIKAGNFCIYEKVFFPYLFWKPVNSRVTSWLDTESIISPQQMYHASAVIYTIPQGGSWGRWCYFRPAKKGHN